MRSDLKIGDFVKIECRNISDILQIIGHNNHEWVFIQKENNKVFPGYGQLITEQHLIVFSFDKKYIGEKYFAISDVWLKELVRRPKIPCKTCWK